MKDKNTAELLHTILNDVKGKKELNTFIDAAYNEAYPISISDYLNGIIIEHPLSKSKVIEKSGLQRNYAYQILQGTKNPSRNKLLALCIALEMDFNQVQRALTINRTGILYAKNKRDAIIIYAIEKRLNIMEINEILYNNDEEMLE